MSNTSAHQQALTDSGFETRPPMLERDSYVPWANRFKHYIERKRETRKFLKNSIDEGPYQMKMIQPNLDEALRVQNEDDLTGHYARDCSKARVWDSNYFMEQILLAKKDEAVVLLSNEQNDFLLADAAQMEEIEELNTNTINKLHELVFSKSDHEQTYHEQPKIINYTNGDDQINSDIIFDDPNVEVNDGNLEHDRNAHDQHDNELKLLARNAYNEAEKVKQQNNLGESRRPDRLEMAKLRSQAHGIEARLNEIERHFITNAIEAIAIYETKTRMDRDSMDQVICQGAKVAKNAKNRRKWEDGHGRSSSKQQNKRHKVIMAHTVGPSNK
ncbi:hypothetical protein Tco_0951229 [Tanacetum coccineum]|uniref:Uncharacterized protein n=1 Tax=Tanacetum coccineum TaxID=301880 RepID=A0ABQ5DUF8_9ASTR